MAFQTSKTLISLQTFIEFGKIVFLYVKMVLTAFWISLGLLLRPLGGLLGDLWELLKVSWATFGGLRTPTGPMNDDRELFLTFWMLFYAPLFSLLFSM